MNLLEDILGMIKPKHEVTPEALPIPKEDKKTTQFSDEIVAGVYSVNWAYQGEYFSSSDKLNLDSYIKSWRLASTYTEVDDAIDEIRQEAIVDNDNEPIVKLNLDQCEEITEKVKKVILEEFEYILTLLEYRKKAAELFNIWYVDGRMAFEPVLKDGDQKSGIIKLNQIDPMNLRLIEADDKGNKAKIRYWEYKNPKTSKSKPISCDLIVYVGSGKIDRPTKLEVSYLHKALKAINNLRLIEDAIVIYRIIRAPEKRVFSIDTGMLPKPKAEEYIKGLIQKFQNKIVYDTVSGTVTNNKNVMAMIEDFYLAKSASGQGSSISTIPAGANLGQLDDLYYFVIKVWKALKVPESRREIKDKAMANFGMQSQIERDELKFSKFIHTLQKQFSNLFTELLYRQLLWKGIITKETLNKIKDKFVYIFATDSYYDEIKQNEMLKGRMEIATNMENFVGKFFTPKDIAIKIFRMTENEWEEKQKEIKQYKDELAKEEAARMPQDTNLTGGDDTGSEDLPPTDEPTDKNVEAEKKTKEFIKK